MLLAEFIEQQAKLPMGDEDAYTYSGIAVARELCSMFHVHALVDVAAGTSYQAMSMVDDLNEATFRGVCMQTVSYISWDVISTTIG